MEIHTIHQIRYIFFGIKIIYLFRISSYIKVKKKKTEKIPRISYSYNLPYTKHYNTLSV